MSGVRVCAVTTTRARRQATQDSCLYEMFIYVNPLIILLSRDAINTVHIHGSQSTVVNL